MAVKFTKSELKKGSQSLANYLCAEIQAAENSRDGLKDRWAQNEQVYRNDPDVRTVVSSLISAVQPGDRGLNTLCGR